MDAFDPVMRGARRGRTERPADDAPREREVATLLGSLLRILAALNEEGVQPASGGPASQEAIAAGLDVSWSRARGNPPSPHSYTVRRDNRDVAYYRRWSRDGQWQMFLAADWLLACADGELLPVIRHELT